MPVRSPVATRDNSLVVSCVMFVRVRNAVPPVLQKELPARHTIEPNSFLRKVSEFVLRNPAANGVITDERIPSTYWCIGTGLSTVRFCHMPSTSNHHWYQLETFKDLEAACETNNAQEILKCFITWLGQLHEIGSPESAEQFLEAIGTTQLAKQLASLRQSADSAQSDFPGSDFIKAVKSVLSTIKIDSPNNPQKSQEFSAD